MPSKLEQLKKEIQRLRPEIMELKFGCELLWHDNQVHKIIEIDNNKFWTDLTNNHCGHNFGFTLKVDLQTEVKEILGRTITLEDVLAVFDGKIKDLENAGEYLQTWKLENGNHNLFNFWLLGKQLDDQSEETINFLHSLIVK